MRLARLSFKRYKAFSSAEQLDIRPLTILIGRNNSGKSVIARLPVLLGHAFSDRASGPLDLDAGGLDFGGSLLDFIHGRSVHGAVELGVRVEDDTRWFDWRARIQHFDEFKLYTIEQLDISSSAGETLQLVRTEVDPRKVSQGYRTATGEHLTLEFRGLVAEGARLPPVLGHAQQSIALAFTPTRYLGPFRERPVREYRYPARMARDVGPFGGAAAGVLGADRIRGDGKLIAQVSDIFQRAFGTGAVDIDERGDTFGLIVHDHLTATPVSLVDAGVGLGQVLSLVVQRVLDSQAGLAGGVEIIEQPELHLHPKAHAEIADLYVSAAANGQKTRFIVETHAENILLRVRRRIAEGRLDADDVAVYWVRDADVDGSRLLKIEIDRFGDVSDWPQGVFAEDFEEAKALARARSKLS